MTAVFFVMRFDVAQIVLLIFELPLDQEIRAVRVIRILLGLEHAYPVKTDTHYILVNHEPFRQPQTAGHGAMLP